MTSEKEQKSQVSNPFLNPIGLWQNYLINCIMASRGFYEKAIKANESWLKAFWDPLANCSWPRTKRNSKGRIAYHPS